MDNLNLDNTPIPSDGTEDTTKVLELCRELINDRSKWTSTNIGLYNYSNIADFLIAIEKINQEIDIKSIYNKLGLDIQKIALEKTIEDGPKIEKFVIDNGINQK